MISAYTHGCPPLSSFTKLTIFEVPAFIVNREEETTNISYEALYFFAFSINVALRNYLVYRSFSCQVKKIGWGLRNFIPLNFRIRYGKVKF